MDVNQVKVCVLRIEGTNCETESAQVFNNLGASAELVHLNQILGKGVSDVEKRSLMDYNILMVPGGFSSGDYIRAGTILAARIKGTLEDQLKEFVEEGRPVLGICNGFQVLVELGLLPAFSRVMTPFPTAILSNNDSNRYECRPTLLKHENGGNCVFTKKLPKDQVIMCPSAHAEGKFLFPKGEEDSNFKRLVEQDQLVFTYVDEKGEMAGYPYNPNGSFMNVAGICNPQGNVFGMMPHPERSFFRYQHHDWTRMCTPPSDDDSQDLRGDGRVIFESVLEHVCSKF